MRKELPPLTALRSFEAVGRHLSFTKAADELSVTQAAISHQIRTIEDFLGVKLFERHGRGVLLTPNGNALLSLTSECFDRIAHLAHEIGQSKSTRRLNITVTPFFSGKWLVPRLTEFSALHPDFELKLHHSFAIPAGGKLDSDLTIYFGEGQWPGTVSDALFSANIIPLCSPRLLKGKFPLTSIENLGKHTLIHEFNHNWWTQWLAQSGIKGVNPRKGPVVDDPNVLVDTAVAGQGVILGPPDFLADYIAAGKLVAPFGAKPHIDIDYFLVYEPSALANANARLFREWVIHQAKTYGKRKPLQALIRTGKRLRA